MGAKIKILAGMEFENLGILYLNPWIILTRSRRVSTPDTAKSV